MEHSQLTSSEPSPSPIAPTASRRRSRRHNCVGIVALAVGKSSRVRACLIGWDIGVKNNPEELHRTSSDSEAGCGKILSFCRGAHMI